MKGYKGMDANMCCRGKQYEIGKTYTEEVVKLCECGMHYCKNLRDVFDYYQREDGNRFFEVEANEVATDGRKSVANTLTVIRELESKEINRNVYGDGYGYGYGYGNGYGNGYGYGYGNGNIQKVLTYCD